MANWIAITWETDRLMLLGANVHNGTATFDRAETFHWHDAGPKTSVFTEFSDSSESKDSLRHKGSSLKKQLGDFVREHRLQKSEVVVVLSRSDVEVRPMFFPPVPVEELPDLVKFQATKEFNGYDGSAPLDFFITNKLDNVSRSTLFPAITPSGKQGDNGISTGAPKHLIASTLRTATFRKIQELCDESNLTLRRVVLRPCEAAYLLRRSPGYNPGRSTLMVELDVHETSQAVLFQGEPVFMRSPKIGCPEDVSASDFAARLIAELKRTRIAVRNEIQGVTVDDVVLCGIGPKFDSLAEQVSTALSIPVRTFDPWTGLSRTGTLRTTTEAVTNDGLPEKPERYASLIGAVLQAARSESGNIDFCNPKKRSEPMGQRRLATGILAVSLVVFACLLAYGFYSRMALTDEIKVLSNKVSALRRTAADVAEQRVQLNAIDTWQADDVNWFDQLDWLSRKAPGARELILTELTFLADNGGSMRLKSLLKDSSVVSPMEERLRDENHVVKTGEKRESPSNTVSPMYGFRYDLSVFLSKESAAADPENDEDLSPPSTPEEELPAVERETDKNGDTPEPSPDETPAPDENKEVRS